LSYRVGSTGFDVYQFQVHGPTFKSLGVTDSTENLVTSDKLLERYQKPDDFSDNHYVTRHLPTSSTKGGVTQEYSQDYLQALAVHLRFNYSEFLLVLLPLEAISGTIIGEILIHTGWDIQGTSYILGLIFSLLSVTIYYVLDAYECDSRWIFRHLASHIFMAFMAGLHDEIAVLIWGLVIAFLLVLPITLSTTTPGQFSVRLWRQWFYPLLRLHEFQISPFQKHNQESQATPPGMVWGTWTCVRKALSDYMSDCY
jgi:hypothetical protein